LEEEEEDGRSGDEDEDSEMEDEEPTPAPEKSKRTRHNKSKVSVADAADADAIRKAELEAERLGAEPGEFEEAVEKAGKRKKAEPEVRMVDSDGEEAGATEENMNKMLLSNKKRKLFTHIKKVQGNRNSQKEVLQQKKIAIVKKQRKEGRKSTA